ncbi:hypothetical protein Ccrd_024616 [Cynara cardunculus var. scolymus]|uniref:Uncharacterized protein n=1 Tax=Cynara cardunculus var. scolymus TaxID=59895 RepID=A0A124SAN2_CYNCS|nr:hypothetical protein Ccrd_024616 [Cynara cardunculus var. scolymus]
MKLIYLSPQLPFPLDILYADPERKLLSHCMPLKLLGFHVSQAYDVLGLYYGIGRSFFNLASAKVLSRSRYEALQKAIKNYTIEVTPDDRGSILQQWYYKECAESRKVERYIWGLKPSIREFVIAMNPDTFSLAVNAAEVTERNKNRQGEEKIIEKRKWEGSSFSFRRPKFIKSDNRAPQSLLVGTCPRYQQERSSPISSQSLHPFFIKPDFVRERETITATVHPVCFISHPSPKQTSPFLLFPVLLQLSLSPSIASVFSLPIEVANSGSPPTPCIIFISAFGNQTSRAKNETLKSRAESKMEMEERDGDG